MAGNGLVVDPRKGSRWHKFKARICSSGKFKHKEGLFYKCKKRPIYGTRKLPKRNKPFFKMIIDGFVIR